MRPKPGHRSNVSKKRGVVFMGSKSTNAWSPDFSKSGFSTRTPPEDFPFFQ